MEIKIPEIKTTEHDVIADNNLDILQGLVTGTLVNQDKTPSTIDLFDYLDQHKDAILAEQKADTARFEQIVVFSMTAQVLSAEKVVKFLRVVESYGLPLLSRYLLISTTLADQAVFDFLAEKKVSVLDQAPNLMIFKTDAQLIYILECMLGSADYQKAHASDINTLIRGAVYTEKSVPVAMSLLKLTSEKVKCKAITHHLLSAAIKADSDLSAKYFPSAAPAVPAKPTKPAIVPEVQYNEISADIAITQAKPTAAAEPASVDDVINDKLSRLEAQITKLTELLAAKVAK